MNCKLCRGLLNRYVDGTLSAPTRASLDEHLESCAECRGFYAGSPSPSTAPLALALAPGLESAPAPLVGVPSLFWLLHDLSLGAWIARVAQGLRQPPRSGIHRWARSQVLRVLSPLSGIVIPLVITGAVVLLANVSADRREELDYLPPVDLKPQAKPEDKPQTPEKPDVPPPDPVFDPFAKGADSDLPGASAGFDSGADAESSNPSSPQIGLSPDGALPVASIVKCPYVAPNKDVGVRTRAIEKGKGKPNGGGEGAVYNALRWLKACQEPDGSWKGSSGGGKGSEGVETALTGMALLTYLAHGETPGDSPEFGGTVEKALRWLVSRQKKDGFPRPYQHAIATYALAEAYTMTGIPSLQRAAAQGVDVLVAGQNASGGFDYQLNSTTRDDTSVMGWCAQALKAAKIARVSSPGLDACMKRAADGFKRNFQGTRDAGGFGYTGPGQTGLSGAGITSLQLLGEAGSAEARGALARLVATDTFAWDAKDWKKIYYLYYNIQARFHEGGRAWDPCTAQFITPLARQQIVVPKAIEGPNGKRFDTGYWDTGNDRGGRVMDTALCTLTLEVYYRYLGTYKKPDDVIAELAPDRVAPADLFVDIVVR